MIIEYLYIKNYRSIINQGLNFSSRYNIEYSDKSTIIIEQNSFYIEDFYGSSIINLKGVIGENGTGKSSILNYIKDVLAYPMKHNEDSLDCIIITYEDSFKQFNVFTHGYSINKSDCKIPNGYDLTINKIEQLQLKYEGKNSDGTSSREYTTILNLISSKSDSNVAVFLSNAFDAKSEIDYGPKVKPYVINLSINRLVKGDIANSEEVSIFKYDEIRKIINLTLNEKRHFPSIKTPDYIRITVKNFMFYDFIKPNKSTLRKSSSSSLDKIKEELRRIWGGIDNKNTELNIVFLLHSNIFLQLEDYIGNENTTKILLSRLKKYNADSFNKNILNDFKKILSTVINDVSKDNRKVTKIEWDNFLNNYTQFIEHVIRLFHKYGKFSTNDNSFEIPISSNSDALNELINLSESTTRNINLLSFSWRDMSSGETMMLRYFANLYELANYLKKDFTNSYKSILFLIDEIELYYHPQWQKTIIKSTLDFINHHFSEYDNQIIFTSHSPLTISDIPKHDLLFLQNKSGKVIIQKDLNDHKQTFASNIHSLLSDSFFMREGHIGDFANHKINMLIDMLLEGKLHDLVKNQETIESLINIIGEPVIKTKLLDIMENRLRANIITIKKDIEKMKIGKK